MNKTTKYAWAPGIKIDVDAKTLARLGKIDQAIQDVLARLDASTKPRKEKVKDTPPSFRFFLSHAQELIGHVEQLNRLRRLIVFGDCQVLVGPVGGEADGAGWEQLAAGTPTTPMAAREMLAAGIERDWLTIKTFQRWTRCCSPGCRMEGPTRLFSKVGDSEDELLFCPFCGGFNTKSTDPPTWTKEDPHLCCPYCQLKGPELIFWRRGTQRTCSNCERTFLPHETIEKDGDLETARDWRQCRHFACKIEGPLSAFVNVKPGEPLSCPVCGEPKPSKVEAPEWNSGDPNMTCPNCQFSAATFLFWRDGADCICPECKEQYPYGKFVPEATE